MPKPFFLHRPSRVFCRFRVPTDLRNRIGGRFIVRALYTSDKTRAKLLAAILAVALVQIFERLRGPMQVTMGWHCGMSKSVGFAARKTGSLAFARDQYSRGVNLACHLPVAYSGKTLH
jgi:hypothetical protein